MYKMYKMYEMNEFYEMYEIYKMFEIYKIFKEGIKNYKTDGGYPSEYGFHNRAKNRQLAKDLTP